MLIKKKTDLVRKRGGTFTGVEDEKCSFYIQPEREGNKGAKARDALNPETKRGERMTGKERMVCQKRMRDCYVLYQTPSLHTEPNH